MRPIKIITKFLLIITLCNCFEEDDDFIFENDILVLTASNFEKALSKYDYLFVMFYAPWCGHCKEFHPEFEKLAKSTKGLFKLGAINCENDRELAERYKIEGFPTVLFFGDDKNKAEEYEGDREAAKIIDFLFEKTKKITNNKLKKLKDIKTDL